MIHDEEAKQATTRQCSLYCECKRKKSQWYQHNQNGQFSWQTQILIFSVAKASSNTTAHIKRHKISHLH